MAHNRNLAKLNDTAAIFSPSIARIAASTARDWSYVESWLRAKLQLSPDRPLPAFERNPDTLKALLSLASFSEAADEERQLVARAEVEALRDVSSSSSARGGEETATVRDDLLETIEDELPKDGQVALEGMAAMAVQAGIIYPEPKDLGRRMLDHQKAIFEAEQMKSRAETIDRHITSDAVTAHDLTKTLRGEEYTPRTGLAKLNLDQQRKVKASAAQLPDLRDRAASLAAIHDATSYPTIQDIAAEEKELLELLGRKRQLELQLAAFEGLPGDPDMARAELEALQEQLRGATSHRDAVFEGLVERESPVRKRR